MLMLMSTRNLTEFSLACNISNVHAVKSWMLTRQLTPRRTGELGAAKQALQWMIQVSLLLSFETEQRHPFCISNSMLFK